MIYECSICNEYFLPTYFATTYYTIIKLLSLLQQLQQHNQYNNLNKEENDSQYLSIHDYMTHSMPMNETARFSSLFDIIYRFIKISIMIISNIFVNIMYKIAYISRKFRT